MASLGIAGTDENKRIRQVQAGLGIAGEVKGKTEAGAMFGISGVGSKGNIEAAHCGIAGPNTRQIISSAMGVAGNFGSATRNQAAQAIVDTAAFKQRDEALSRISRQSDRLGDRAAREAWQKGVWFADFTYVSTPFGEGERGVMGWRKGREQVFGPRYAIMMGINGVMAAKPLMHRMKHFAGVVRIL